MPKISIIVPAFNEEKLIARSLRSIRDALSEFTRVGFDTELVVCDNNSTDRTSEFARAGGARVVFEPVNQIARARNTGAKAATGEWLLFVDADSFPSAELFRAAAEAMRRPDCLAGGAPVRMDERHFGADCFSGVWNWVSRLKRWPAGSFIFCEAAAFRELGGFSEKLFASEEIELFQRVNRLARSRGRRVVILGTPLITSARKIRIYSGSELLRFLVCALLRPRATMKDRDRCGLWYDGRR